MHFIETHPLSYAKVLMRNSMANETEYLMHTVGYLGWNYVTMPLTVIILSYMLLFGAGLYKEDADQKSAPIWLGWASLALGTLVIIGILTTFYVSFSGVRAPYVGGVQGRYFIPALAFVIFGICRVVPVRVQMNERQAVWLFGIANTACLTIAALYYYLATY